MITTAIFIICTAFLILDIFSSFLTNKVGMLIGTVLIPHSFLCLTSLFILLYDTGTALWQCIAVTVILSCAALYWLIRINIKPYTKKLISGLRVRAIYGGKCLVKYMAFSTVIQVIFYIFAFRYDFWNLSLWSIITDSVLTLVIMFCLGLNGLIRIIACCKRLVIVKRIICFLLLPVPIVNIFVFCYLYKIAESEYDFEENKEACNLQRAESQLCSTKYPLLMVHGIGFKDFRYFNYWGRIPRELIRNGATVYYGNQEACGTVINNAEEIKEKILEIMDKTGCEKVNIIAHSKGGLDSRYAASKLGMDKYIASITTIGTPHRGSYLSDEAEKHISDKFYRKVANFFDKRFKSIGDKNPDFYTACHQFASSYAIEFNKEVPDSPDVYYQSYSSVMKNMFSFDILAISYLIIKKYGRNDGLVTVDSAKWGNFKGIFESKYTRGISHGDTIDLKREDFKGFDPREKYVQIVSELKEMGF